MKRKRARADVTPIRQQTQFTCMATSLSMALRALGRSIDEEGVNRVMGCEPMRGASWEDAMAAAQYFGMRTTLVVPCTLGTLRAWTDAGTPVLIAWNPEGRDWSHASVVFDVTTDAEGNTFVHVADPNIPDPEATTRAVPLQEFYAKWVEKWPDYLVRRPAMAVEREVTADGRAVFAGKKELRSLRDRMRSQRMKNGPAHSPEEGGPPPLSPEAWKARQEQGLGGLPGAGRGGPHKSVTDYRRRPKHPGRELEATEELSMTPKEFESALRRADEKGAQFEKGQSMTVDEVSEVVGPKFKEMNEDPPEGVRKLRDEMEKKAAGDFEIQYRVPGKSNFKPKKFKDEAAAQKWVQKFRESEGDDVEVRWPEAKTAATRLGGLTAEDYRIALAGTRGAKFERGVSMTIEEVAAVVGPAFQEMNENPPDSVLKVREEMKKKATDSEDLRAALEDLRSETDPSRKIEAAEYILANSEGLLDATRSLWVRRARATLEKLKLARKTASAFVLQCAECETSAAARSNYFAGFGNLITALPSDWAYELGNDDELGAVYCPDCVGIERPGYDTLQCSVCSETDDIATEYVAGLGEIGTSLPEGWGVLPTDHKTLGPMYCPVCLEVGLGRVAASGLYGATKDLERCCTGSIGRLQKTARRIAKKLYARDAESPAFLQEHAKRARSRSARLLVAAMREISPAAQLDKTASTRTDKGLYGFRQKTSKLALDACSELRYQAGVLASDLNARRASQYEGVTGFFKEHSKTARCGYAAMLLEAYPPAEKTATSKTANDPRWSAMMFMSEVMRAGREGLDAAKNEDLASWTAAYQRALKALAQVAYRSNTTWGAYIARQLFRTDEMMTLLLERQTGSLPKGEEKWIGRGRYAATNEGPNWQAMMRLSHLVPLARSVQKTANELEGRALTRFVEAALQTLSRSVENCNLPRGRKIARDLAGLYATESRDDGTLASKAGAVRESADFMAAEEDSEEKEEETAP